MIKIITKVLMAAACVSPALAQDILYTNAKIYTVDEKQAWAEALLSRDGQIEFVGSREQARSLAKANVQVKDLGGRLMLPGLVESHAHPVFGSVMSAGLLLDNTTASVESYLQQIKIYAEENPKLDVIFGFGFYADTFGESGPLKGQLDNIVGDRPVVFLDDGGHSAWANSAAFKLAGIDENFPDPEPGVHFYRRDNKGVPTGHALESQAVFPLMMAAGAFDQDKIEKSLQLTLPVFSQMGFTTVFDAGMLVGTEGGHKALQKMERDKQLKLRMVTAYSLYAKEQVNNIVESAKAIQSKYQSDLIRPTVVKIHNDGTTEAETAAQLKPYLNNKSNMGAMILAGKDLADVVVDIDKAGFDVHIHAIGDAAVREALNAFEQARKVNGANSARFSMAHVELFSLEDAPRFAELDVVAQTTPVWGAMERKHSTRVLGAKRANRLFSFRPLITSGARMTFGSDFPVSEGFYGLNPMVQIESGVTRSLPGEEPSKAQPTASSAFTLDTLIRGYTINGAYQLNLETEIGSLEKGKRTDFVVLDKNIFTLAPQEIHTAKPVLTVLNGEVTFSQE